VIRYEVVVLDGSSPWHAMAAPGGSSFTHVAPDRAGDHGGALPGAIAVWMKPAETLIVFIGQHLV